jgi:hypothetical protein
VPHARWFAWTTGRWLLQRILQRLFEHMLLAFAALATLRLIGAF